MSAPNATRNTRYLEHSFAPRESAVKRLSERAPLQPAPARQLRRTDRQTAQFPLVGWTVGKWGEEEGGRILRRRRRRRYLFSSKSEERLLRVSPPDRNGGHHFINDSRRRRRLTVEEEGNTTPPNYLSYSAKFLTKTVFMAMKGYQGGGGVKGNINCFNQDQSNYGGTLKNQELLLPTHS